MEARQPTSKKFIPGFSWFILVLVLLCLPGSDIPTPQTWLNDIYFDKWVHTGLFSVLTFLFIYPFAKADLSKKEKKNKAIKIAIAVIIWGITTEFIQKFFIPDRAFDLLDWAADSFGVLLAYTWCRIKYIN